MCVCVCVCVCVCTQIDRFIIRNWLAWLWRLRIPSSVVGMPETQERQNVVRAQVQKPEKQETVQSKSKGWKGLCPSSRQSGRRTSLLFRLFVPFTSSTDWLRPTNISRGWWWGVAICFTQPRDSNLNLIQKYLHNHTQN